MYDTRTMPDAEDDLLNSTQAGVILGKSGKTILRMADAGTIHVAARVAGSNGVMRLFRRSDVDLLAESMTKQQAS